MSVPFIGGSADIQQNTNVTNSAIRTLNGMEVVQVFKDDQGQKAVVLGKKLNNKRGMAVYENDSLVVDIGQLANDDYGLTLNADGIPRVQLTSDGMKVSQSGVDVTSASNAQLIFNSSQNIPKIVSTSTATVTLPVGYTSYQEYQTTVTHNLGITPLVIGSVDFPAATLEGRFTLPITLVESSGGTNGVSAFLRLYENHFICCVKARNGGGDTYKGNYTFRYYILQETAN